MYIQAGTPPENPPFTQLRKKWSLGLTPSLAAPPQVYMHTYESDPPPGTKHHHTKHNHAKLAPPHRAVAMESERGRACVTLRWLRRRACRRTPRSSMPVHPSQVHPCMHM